MDEPWVEQRVHLKFLFGGIRFGTAGFKAALCPGPLEAPSPGADPEFPLGGFPTGVSVVQTPSHPIHRRLRRLALFSHGVRYVPHQYRRYSLDLQGKFDDYLRTFSSKSRFTLRKKLRKFAERFGGTIAWRVYRTPEEIPEFHSLARQVSQRTYQEQLLDAGLPATEEFRTQLREAAARDGVRGFLLFDGDKPIAYMCCLIKGGVVRYDYVGHDHEYHDWSPGIVLLYSALEELHREGTHKMFDFTEGEGQLKEVFSRSSTECADIYYFRWSVRSLLLVAVHSAFELGSSASGRMLRVLGIKPFAKRIMRGLASRLGAARGGLGEVSVPQCAEALSR